MSMSRHACRAAAVIIAVALASAPLAAQRDKLPEGPAKPGFDITRFSDAGWDWFDTFHVDKTEPLRDALRDRRVAEDTRLLVSDTPAGRLAFITDQMAYHHLAQGRSPQGDWLVSF